MTFYGRLSVLREQPDTARAGMKWTEEENNELMKAIMEGVDLEEVSKKHKRTVTGVKSRVMTNALQMIKDRDLTLHDVAELVHISIEDLTIHKKKQDEKASTPKVKITASSVNEATESSVSYHDVMSILTEIRDYLKIIALK